MKPENLAQHNLTHSSSIKKCQETSFPKGEQRKIFFLKWNLKLFFLNDSYFKMINIDNQSGQLLRMTEKPGTNLLCLHLLLYLYRYKSTYILQWVWLERS